MKKLLLSFCALFIGFFLYSQQVPRDQVVLEIGTGTWCYYCPGSALGADDMIANGHDVAVVEHHGPMGQDPFATTASVARNTYYGLTGYPTAYFDGGNAVVGGNHTTSMYSSYLSKYNLRKTIPSSFTLQMFGMNDGLDYTIIVNAERVDTYSGGDLVLHLVLTESDIMYSWQGLSELHFVNRLMVPNQNGTPINFNTAESVSTELNFTLNGAWVPEHCELVTFIQDISTKEIVQGSKVALSDLLPMNTNNATCMEMGMVPVTNCAGEVAPTITIMNEGADQLTTLDINYMVNDESLNTFNWTGNLAYGQMEEVMLPAVSFEIMPDNDLVIYTTNPNGNPDEDPMNDTTMMSFMSAMQAIPDIYLFLKLDDNPGETSYELLDSEGNAVYSAGPFTTPSAFIKDTFNITMDDCYTFVIHDAGGDGLINPGYYELRQGNFAVIHTNNMFAASQEMVQFSVDVVGVEETAKVSGYSVYPNPASDKAYVSFNLDKPGMVSIDIYNVVGEKVFSNKDVEFGAGAHAVPVNLNEMGNGVYFVSIKAGQQIQTLKMTVH
ncbi:MAG: T9SS type A sorting domain-containing protein [Bacteroidales bacterium]|nr:T9SS type A sorting domain-containing protein [Bacteroidales bacterium]